MIAIVSRATVLKVAAVTSRLKKGQPLLIHVHVINRWIARCHGCEARCSAHLEVVWGKRRQLVEICLLRRIQEIRKLGYL